MTEHTKKTRILFVEDDVTLQKSISYILEQEGFHIVCARTGEEALHLAKKERPDLLLLDLMLPGMNGFDVCRAIKRDPCAAGMFIIMATGKGMVEDIVKGLEEYADDYITKPFDPKILIARIHAVLRRGTKSEEGDKRKLLELAGLTIDCNAYEAFLEGRKLDLTKTEFDILCLLVGRPNVVFTRSRILDHIRADSYPVTERVVDYQITGLRKKLGKAGGFIKTVRGVGYKFSEEVD